MATDRSMTYMHVSDTESITDLIKHLSYLTKKKKKSKATRDK